MYITRIDKDIAKVEIYSKKKYNYFIFKWILWVQNEFILIYYYISIYHNKNKQNCGSVTMPLCFAIHTYLSVSRQQKQFIYFEWSIPSDCTSRCLFKYQHTQKWTNDDAVRINKTYFITYMWCVTFIVLHRKKMFGKFM